MLTRRCPCWTSLRFALRLRLLLLLVGRGLLLRMLRMAISGGMGGGRGEVRVCSSPGVGMSVLIGSLSVRGAGGGLGGGRGGGRRWARGMVPWISGSP
jgi:hypothetical protein